MSVEHTMLLTLAAFAAGAIDAIAGGGGLITLPALLAAGLSPHEALGTNKGQSVFGSGAALFRYAKAGLVNARQARVTFPAGLLAAFLGAIAVSWLSPAVLRPLILVLLLAAGTFLAFRTAPVKVLAGPVSKPLLRAGMVAAVVGAYDGFFGPGTGTFLVMGFILFLNAPIPEATADAKVVNFASNLATLALFASKGWVNWQIALPMAAAQFAGAFLGAHMAVKKGQGLIRKVILGVVVLLVAKLGSDIFAAAK